MNILTIIEGSILAGARVLTAIAAAASFLYCLWIGWEAVSKIHAQPGIVENDGIGQLFYAESDADKEAGEEIARKDKFSRYAEDVDAIVALLDRIYDFPGSSRSFMEDFAYFSIEHIADEIDKQISEDADREELLDEAVEGIQPYLQSYMESRKGNAKIVIRSSDQLTDEDNSPAYKYVLDYTNAILDHKFNVRDEMERVAVERSEGNAQLVSVGIVAAIFFASIFLFLMLRIEKGIRAR